MENEESEKQSSAVARTMRVMELLSGHKSINLEQLARESELPKATLLRFLGALANLGYVYRDPYDQYSLTLKMFSVGSRSLEHLELVRVARPIAESLAERLRETVHMGIREETSAIYVLKVESKYTIRMHSRVGKSIPLYCTGIGKALLADLPKEERDAALDAMELVPFTENTIKTRAALVEELAAITDSGVSLDREEHEEGIMCIAAPVRDYSGSAVAALSVSWPLFRYAADREAEYVDAVKTAARRISELLGN